MPGSVVPLAMFLSLSVDDDIYIYIYSKMFAQTKVPAATS